MYVSCNMMTKVIPLFYKILFTDIEVRRHMPQISIIF